MPAVAQVFTVAYGVFAGGGCLVIIVGSVWMLAIAHAKKNERRHREALRRIANAVNEEEV